MESDEFSFTDAEFMKLINYICEKEAGLGNEYPAITEMSELVIVDRMDSLAAIMFFVWLSELFGIDDDTVTAFAEGEAFTVTDLKEFIISNRTRTHSYSIFEEFVSRCL